MDPMGMLTFPATFPASTGVNWTGQPKKKHICQWKLPSHLEIASNYLSFTKLHSVLEEKNGESRWGSGWKEELGPIGIPVDLTKSMVKYRI